MIASGTEIRTGPSRTRRTRTRTGAGADSFHSDRTAGSSRATHFPPRSTAPSAESSAFQSSRAVCCHRPETNSPGSGAPDPSRYATCTEREVSCHSGTESDVRAAPRKRAPDSAAPAARPGRIPRPTPSFHGDQRTRGERKKQILTGSLQGSVLTDCSTLHRDAARNRIWSAIPEPV
jgi:hypothetical protein